MDVGRLINEQRKRRRYSANALAQEAGLTVNTVLAVERGANCTVETLRILLQTLHQDKPLDSQAVLDLLVCLGIEPDQIREAA